MIIAEKVYDAMNQKLVDPSFHIDPCGIRFFSRRFKTNDNVAHQVGIDFGKGAFAHRKRNDVGRSGSIQIRLVQPSDFILADKKNGELAVRTCQSFQQSSRFFPYGVLIDAVTMLSVVDVDLHQYR